MIDLLVNIRGFFWTIKRRCNWAWSSLSFASLTANALVMFYVAGLLLTLLACLLTALKLIVIFTESKEEAGPSNDIFLNRKVAFPYISRSHRFH